MFKFNPNPSETVIEVQNFFATLKNCETEIRNNIEKRLIKIIYRT